MRLIDRKDIEGWADQFDSKGNFPYLISKLVHGTTPVGTYVDIPVGSAVFTGGWDGLTNCPHDTQFVPKDITLWEFGTESNPKGKADEDYEKRTTSPDGYNPAECTFIFVTPRFWSKKETWRNAKVAQGKWKDVRVYDSSILAQWLDLASAVARWFSAYLTKYPFDGIITIEEFWKEWSVGPMGTLPPDVIVAGRSVEANALQEFLDDAPGIKAVQAASKEEATAFIVAAATQFEPHARNRFASKTLIIDTPGNFRSVRINARSLNLIARFDEPSILYAAASEGHHVIVPLGPDDNINQEPIRLPTIDRDGQIKGLIDMGLSADNAEKMSKEAGRSVTILKRLLQFPQFKLAQINQQLIRQMIPALLVGRWHDQKEGDHDLMEIIAGEKYETFIEKAGQWLSLEESPIIKIGDLWRLLSPLDAWATFSNFITKTDINALAAAFKKAFMHGNPQAVAKTESQRVIFEFNKEKTYSSWIREGLLQSYILVGIYGDSLKLSGIANGQLWVDKQIDELLWDASGELWQSLDHEMPLIAEASPEAFIDNLNKSLKQTDQPLLAVFKEEDGILMKNSHHTGLLWALESLAWLPDFFLNATLILAKLSEKDPGGQLANRPFNSLVEIFKPWHYQTIASIDQRIEALKKICEETKSVGWNLLLTLLPEYHGIAHPTHKMRWRVFNWNLNNQYTYSEIGKIHNEVVDLLIGLFDGTDSQLASLLDHSVDMNSQDREKVLSLAKGKKPSLSENNYESWKTVKRILSQHRSHSDTDWALPSEELLKFQEIYELLKPQGSIERYTWLFDDWPDFPEGTKYDERQDEKVAQRRAEAVEAIVSDYGVEKLVELSTKVKEPWSLGLATATVVKDDIDIEKVISAVDFNVNSQLRFIKNFWAFNSPDRGIEWTEKVYEYLLNKHFDENVRVEFLITQPSTNEVWDFVENKTDLKNEYWNRVQPWLFRSTMEEKLRGIRNLIDHKRFFTAIDQAGYNIETLPSDLLVELLDQTATNSASEEGRFDYHLDQLLDAMESRQEIPPEKKIRLEWLYMPILSRHGSRRLPENLHRELAKSPEFFVEILTWLYMPKNKKKIQETTDSLSQEIIVARAESARSLLNSWKTIPGLEPDGILNQMYLEEWIIKARKLAGDVDRLEVADAQIGQMLAKIPETGENWLPENISLLIEKLDSDALNRNFSVGLFNKRGSSSRTAFEGGNIERRHASYFIKLNNNYKRKYPKVAKIFKELAENYLAYAKREDDDAERSRLEY